MTRISVSLQPSLSTIFAVTYSKENLLIVPIKRLRQPDKTISNEYPEPERNATLEE
jgi:hypothetical protein